MRAFALFSLLGMAASPVGAQRPCLTSTEAASLALVAMPEIMRDTGALCAARLPATSLLKQPGSALLARYDRSADRAWPQARRAIVKLSDPMVETMLQSQYARPLLTTLLVPQIVGRIDAGDCVTIDRLVTNLAPLPPENAANVLVTALRYLKQEKSKGRPVAVPDLPLCTEPN